MSLQAASKPVKKTIWITITIMTTIIMIIMVNDHHHYNEHHHDHLELLLALPLRLLGFAARPLLQPFGQLCWACAWPSLHTYHIISYRPSSVISSLKITTEQTPDLVTQVCPPARPWAAAHSTWGGCTPPDQSSRGPSCSRTPSNHERWLLMSEKKRCRNGQEEMGEKIYKKKRSGKKPVRHVGCWSWLGWLENWQKSLNCCWKKKIIWNIWRKNIHICPKQSIFVKIYRIDFVVKIPGWS